MPNEIDPFRAALLRMSATVDELLELHRAREAAGAAAEYRADAAMRSPSDSFRQQIELTLRNAEIVIQNDGDRAALVAIAKVVHAAKLLDDQALARVLRDFGIQ